MKQITILSTGKDDLIADITQMLAHAGIDIETITAENYGGQAVAILTVSNDKEAMAVIQRRKEFTVIGEDALLVRIEDALGALAKISRRFADSGIPIRSIRFVERHDGHALVAISTERTSDALALVQDILVS